jgi:CelD/BcsL family acetyltransferase involved in cellulose biosynthesis
MIRPLITFFRSAIFEIPRRGAANWTIFVGQSRQKAFESKVTVHPFPPCGIAAAVQYGFIMAQLPSGAGPNPGEDSPNLSSGCASFAGTPTGGASTAAAAQRQKVRVSAPVPDTGFLPSKRSGLESSPLAPSTCFEIDPLTDPRWAALVDDHRSASVFNSVNWLRTLRAVYGYEPVVVTTCPGGARLTNGLVFCRINSWLTGRRLVSLPFSDHCEPLIDTPDELEAMLAHLKQQVIQKKWKYLEIRPLAHEPNARCGLSRGTTYLFHCLDLRPTADQLFRNFHKDCVQRKIRRAEREKLQYEDGTSEELLRKFYRLLVMTRRRQYLPPQPLAWFRGLIAALGKDLKIRVASRNDVPVASILTLSHRSTVVFKYGCSNAALNRFGGTAFLFWKTIQEAKACGLETFELGRSDIDNLGLIAFKERWGATRSTINYWTYPHGGPRSGASFSSVAQTWARHMVPMTPDLALEAVGTLLYKHIG